MTALRDELRHLVDDLPEDQVPAALALVRQLTPAESADQWPPAWFGSIRAGRDDTSERVDDILRAEYGRPADPA